MTENSGETAELLTRAGQGNQSALGTLFTRHRDRLRLMVRLRLDSRLRGRIDPSDVIQESCLEASARLEEYLQNPKMPFFLWLRFITAQKLLVFHRRHLGARMRDAGREISLFRGAMPEASSAALAAQLVGARTTPSQAAVRAEMQVQLQEALNSMDAMDREILAMRHFEQLSNSDIAKTLNIKESTATQRYARALLKLKEILRQLPGFAEK